MNPYIELGIAPTATLEDLKKAYRQAVLRYHPDSARGKGDPEKFNSVVSAYRQLTELYEKNRHSSTRSHQGPYQRTRTERPSHRTGPLVDQATTTMPIYSLIRILENSENPFVRMVAIEALVAKRSPTAHHLLLNYLYKTDAATQKRIIRILGREKLSIATSALFQFVADHDLELKLEAIRALEQISVFNRAKILEQLKELEVNHWKEWVQPFKSKVTGLLKGIKVPKLGKILLEHDKIDDIQLELGLLLQKRHNLLLGEIFRKLEYISYKDMQEALAWQKHLNRQ